MQLPNPCVFAHRGASGDAPENTLSSFQLAVTQGAHAVELDAKLSQDGHIIVIHDRTLKRTTNGSGYVHKTKFDDLRKLDAGSWFDPQFSGEKIPTLEQVLEALKGRIGVNIEIKPEAFEAHAPKDAVERQVWALVQEKGMQDDALQEIAELPFEESEPPVAVTLYRGAGSERDLSPHSLQLPHSAEDLTRAGLFLARRGHHDPASAGRWRHQPHAGAFRRQSGR